MADFTWLPSSGFTTDSSPRTRVAKFGDGYVQRIPDGINNIDQTWNLQFQSQKLVDANAIMNFLESKKGSIPFTWRPVGEDTDVVVVCTKWSKTYDSSISATISATFERVYGRI